MLRRVPCKISFLQFTQRHTEHENQDWNWKQVLFALHPSGLPSALDIEPFSFQPYNFDFGKLKNKNPPHAQTFTCSLTHLPGRYAFADTEMFRFSCSEKMKRSDWNTSWTLSNDNGLSETCAFHVTNLNYARKILSFSFFSSLIALEPSPTAYQTFSVTVVSFTKWAHCRWYLHVENLPRLSHFLHIPQVIISLCLHFSLFLVCWYDRLSAHGMVRHFMLIILLIRLIIWTDVICVNEKNCFNVRIKAVERARACWKLEMKKKEGKKAHDENYSLSFSEMLVLGESESEHRHCWLLLLMRKMGKKRNGEREERKFI